MRRAESFFLSVSHIRRSPLHHFTTHPAPNSGGSATTPTVPLLYHKSAPQQPAAKTQTVVFVVVVTRKLHTSTHPRTYTETASLRTRELFAQGTDKAPLMLCACLRTDPLLLTPLDPRRGRGCSVYLSVYKRIACVAAIARARACTLLPRLNCKQLISAFVCARDTQTYKQPTHTSIRITLHIDIYICFNVYVHTELSDTCNVSLCCADDYCCCLCS